MSKELRFDIVEAWYVWLCAHHDGKGAHRGDSGWWCSYSNLSTIPTRFGFKPAVNLSYETLTERGKEIHDDLCRRALFCDCLEEKNMNVVNELLGTLGNELNNNSKSWTFGGRMVVNAYQEEDGLVLEFEDCARITLRAEVPGETKTCPECGKEKGGHPDWWRNIDHRAGRLKYGCSDCVVEAEERRRSEAEAEGPEREPGDQSHCSGR